MFVGKVLRLGYQYVEATLMPAFLLDQSFRMPLSDFVLNNTVTGRFFTVDCYKSTSLCLQKQPSRGVLRRRCSENI